MKQSSTGIKQRKMETRASNSTSLANRVEVLERAAEDRELQNLELIYELEYKVERMAGIVSRSLHRLRSVQLTGVDCDSLNKTRELIQTSLKKQLRQQCSKVAEGQRRKAELDDTISSASKLIRQVRKQVADLRKQIKENSQRQQQAQKREWEVGQHQTELELALKSRSLAMNAFRSSQEKLADVASRLQDLDSNLSLRQRQEEALRLEQQRLERNRVNVEQYAELEQYKMAMAKDYQQKGQLFQKMSRQRVEWLVEIRVNIARIEEQLRSSAAKIYEQRTFLRAGEQQRQHDREYGASFEEKRYLDAEEELAEQRGEIQQQYEQEYLRPMDQKWLKMKASLDRYLSIGVPSRLEGSDHPKTRLPKRFFRNTLMSDSEQDSQYQGEASHLNSSKLKAKHRKLKTEVDHISQSRQLKRYDRKSENTLRMNSIEERVSMRLGKQHSLDYRALPPVSHKSQSTYPVPQPIQIPSRSKQWQPTPPISKQNSLELVSVGESENDSNFEYVEVELTKQELKELSKQPKRNS